jgi:protease-4
VKTFIRRLSADVPLLTADALAFLVGSAVTPQDVQAAEHPVYSKYREAMKPKSENRGNITIVPVQGVLAYNPDIAEMLFDGVEDSRSVLSMIHDADEDEDCKGILLRMDTPGGMMLGGPEIGDAVAASRKPVIAHVGGMGASLGYMIASQADEVIANRSAIVGSIGVIANTVDYTAYLAQLGIKFEYFTNKEAKYKAAGAVGTSLNQEQRDYIQKNVDGAFSVFKSMVLAVRPQVKVESMQGQTYRGSEAKAIGLVDRVGDENFALSVLRARIAS